MWLPRGGGGRGGKEWEFGIRWCQLIYIGWINNKVLRYSTRNHAQYTVIHHNGKQFVKRVYACITESFCYSVEINTTVYINYTSVRYKNKKLKNSLAYLENHLWSYLCIFFPLICFPSFPISLLCVLTYFLGEREMWPLTARSCSWTIS